jgi:hypothetical protein
LQLAAAILKQPSVDWLHFAVFTVASDGPVTVDVVGSTHDASTANAIIAIAIPCLFILSVPDHGNPTVAQSRPPVNLTLRWRVARRMVRVHIRGTSGTHGEISRKHEAPEAIDNAG